MACAPLSGRQKKSWMRERMIRLHHSSKISADGFLVVAEEIAEAGGGQISPINCTRRRLAIRSRLEATRREQILQRRTSQSQHMGCAAG